MSEDYTYTDGATQIAVHYGITNVSGAPVSLRAGALADLYVGANDNGNGVISNLAPRFVGGRDESNGLVYGLQEITPWAALQEGDFELVFNNFAGNGLNNTVDSTAPDNGVGVMWQLDNIAPGETRGIDARWLMAAPAPPGTISPGALGSTDFQPDRYGVIHSQGGVLPPPVAGKSVNVKVRNGRVFYKPPGAKKFIELKDPAQVPIGTIFDTLKGNVSLTSAADKKGGIQNAWFYSGVFKVTQTKGSQPITELVDGPKLELPEGQEGQRCCQEEEDGEAVGRRQGQVPHPR